MGSLAVGKGGELLSGKQLPENAAAEGVEGINCFVARKLLD